MGAGHGGAVGGGGLHHAGDSVAHRLPAETKLVATLGFVVAVVLTPSRAVPVLLLDGLLVLAVARSAGLPAGLVVRRLRVELPFLAFAAFLPFAGADPRFELAGLSLSEPGVWGAWNIAAKGTLGVLAAIVLGATTPVVELLAGLERLRCPKVLTAIAGFMVRYLDVVTEEATRMRLARLSRADDPRWLWQARGVAATAGTLFVRSFERGERVHLAMVSRGYTGSLPGLHDHEAGGGAGAWAVAAAVPLVATALLLGSRLW
ncbi:MAG: cobalt ECF transporter T component CbiQ [Acidimicrobiia bacterium]